MPTVIVETGAIVPGANSYVDPTSPGAAAYFDGHLYASVWTAASADQKAAAVIQSTRTLDATFTWAGQAVDQFQPLGWPRIGATYRGQELAATVVPPPVIQATLEMALALLTRDRTSDTAAASPLSGLNLGDGALQLSFGESPNTVVNPIPDIVASILRELGVTNAAGSGGMRPVFRR